MAIGLAQQSKKRDLFEQVMLEFVLEKDVRDAAIGWQVTSGGQARHRINYQTTEYFSFLGYCSSSSPTISLCTGSPFLIYFDLPFP